ncbi:male-specific lethal 1 homolog isoform X1 [Macaca nemestrina]|uniref:Male-specific lethal 1 homolog n=8 Tax=Cercopithecidae TaxID=9527 RepID=F6XDL9_MACMU|nr:male-specific lethal 1 homolog isoform X1 [Macaca mulatta]XP_005584130.1 male-specific lethal 1 homolog isoform X1 [Macaca fascicularis]XP_008010994.1 male-specific lethal 1 homolog isoform X1 [Chlorocebus sabaeus]XP_010352793.1 male-specific lethal 1 homolog isoform X1 [Rhinopithecus roxellana]XP_011723565.1 male-specific lethal 1 homolog isoform X1 [Macaca nemestrina]XP_011901882.1 PREDICTED: male-specific lethal 1 homolog isoform X1 [Cercocebus atys]XP_017806198.2 male-specific lethal 1
MTMRSAVFKAAAAPAGGNPEQRLDYERAAALGGPEDEPGAAEAHFLPRHRKLKEPGPPLASSQGGSPAPSPAGCGGKGRGLLLPAGAAPGQQEESWGGSVPLPCPPPATKQAGIGGEPAAAGCSPRPKYQAVLPIQTGSLVAAAKEPTPWAGDKGGAASPAATASDPAGPPPLPLPGPPPLAPTATAGTLAASEGRWKSMRKSPLGGGGGSGASSQAACLKQILLLQLDLIEQQQQQLQAKEKEIEELKSERDTLLARIERMERRMQLVKKDNEKERHKLFQGYETEEREETELSEKIKLECQPELSETSQTLPPKPFSCGRSGKGHKRKSPFGSTERKTPVKKLAPEFSKVKTKTPKHSPIKEEPCGSLSETVCKRELRSQETPEKPRSSVDTPPRLSTPQKGPSTHPKEKAFSSEIEDLPYLSTTEMYLCRWHQPPPSPLPLRESSPKKEETVARCLMPSSVAGETSVLAVPSWRDHSVEPLRDPNPSDLLENLDDSVFSKRHAKLELDEKRRKRWDIQRIREQRILQRLQLRMYKKKGIQESEPEVTSFFPEPDDVESLMITPFLPVVAFGRPLPKLTPQNFELPWLDERSRCRLEIQKKQTPHRTCRK